MYRLKHRSLTAAGAVIAIGLAVALTLILAAAAHAWPGPIAGQPVCIPNPDRTTFHVDPTGTPPFPRGSHQPEHGTCEGPVVPVTPAAPVVVPAPPAPSTTTVTVVQQVPVPVPTPDVTTCTSRRVYRFTVRARYRGDRVTGIRSVFVRGEEQYGSWRKVHKDGRTRFQVTADYRGLVVPKGQLRTVTVRLWVHGRRHSVRTVQFLRLCLSRDGNPDDASSQDRARR